MRIIDRTTSPLPVPVSAVVVAALALSGCGPSTGGAATGPSTSSQASSAPEQSSTTTATISQGSEPQQALDVDPAILDGRRQVSVQVADTSKGLELLDGGEVGLLAGGAAESSRVVLVETSSRSGTYQIRLVAGEVDDECWSVTPSATVEVQPCDTRSAQQLFTLAPGGSPGTVVILSAGASLVAQESRVVFADADGTSLSLVDRGEYEDPFDE
jgi:hypothetical protein